MNSISTSRWQALIDRYGLHFILGMGTILTFSALLKFPFCYEDAYITFRYAQRLSEGLGFTYNDSIRTLGTTTPLFTIILAGLAKISSPDYIPEIARVIGSICYLISAFLIHKIVLKMSGSRFTAFLAGLIYVCYPPSVASATSGMEIPVFICLSLLSYYLILEKRMLLGGITVGILLAIRPDGLVWALALSLLLWNRLRQLQKFILGFILMAIPLYAALSIYFGNPVPLSIIAKRISYAPYHPIDFQNLLRVLGIFLPAQVGFNNVATIAIWLAVIVIITYSLKNSVKAKDYSITPAIGFVLLYAAFLWLGRARAFRWYGFPVFPMLLIALFHSGHHYFKNHRFGQLLRRATMAGIIILTALCAGYVLLASQSERLQAMQALEARAFYFRDHTPPEAKIFLEPIAQVGYYSGRYIICEIGLVSPEVVEIKKAFSSELTKNCKWYFEVLRKFKPDYLMLTSSYFDRNRLFPYEEPTFFSDADDSDYFFSHYEAIDLKLELAEDEIKRLKAKEIYVYKRKVSKDPIWPIEMIIRNR
ncbi:MAG: hypothetical protein CO189_10165 [candidate division Zixibacteria bacterium CG_4_9_14_3_um_filter_46_8]|nr:MAG: hypothetical protein CO189_10165 [candidate division Zixibacteria bacterium CG_4_9_14_3_um_filter_46_8]